VTVSTPATSALLGVYSRVGPLFTSGDGCELISSDGTRYLDFVAGIAVNALGYNHPVLRDAVTRALESGLVHVSNLYYTEPGERLAEFLVERSFAQQVFFCNSGAEANEAAFKFARKWSGGQKPGIVAFTGSFHGRLFASLAATDRPDFRRPFEPLVPGVKILPLYDEAELEEALGGGGVGAVIIEPVQGEGGVRPVEAGWLELLRALCDRHGAALIFDEVQCGLGRTGTLFAYEQAGGRGGIAPDLLTLAKPLAGGLPMGAVLVTERIAAALAPGDHATTFGGGPFVATIALEVLKTIAEPEFLRAVVVKGDRLGAGLKALAGKPGRVRSARGRGLMWGLELSEAAAPIVAAARERQLLVASAGPNVLRLVPPLIVSESEIDRAVGILAEVLA
jgi:acetylornithine/N-succinyldiaminopimelate aminotransferase